MKKPAKPAEEVIVRGRVKAPQLAAFPLPKAGQIKRYIFTTVQNNTPLFEDCWHSLQALAEHYKAQIVVSRYTYDKMSYKNSKLAKPGTGKSSDGADLWYDPRVLPFVRDERIQVAPGLVWCGELNILPTAERPLSGLESYTGRSSTIVPHPRIALESVASGKFEATKLMYTTGTLTQRNYIQRKAGQKAEFHHAYGGLLVEVNDKGSWWCRQLNSDSDGVIYDLDVKAWCVGVTGHISTGNRIEGVTWGDIHVGQMDQGHSGAGWGPGGILDTLRPKYQFMHDVLDFKSRNHHESKNPHKLFEKYVKGLGNVQREVATAARFLSQSWRKSCLTVVVDSNHDNALERWLREADYRHDPVNAIFFLRAQLAKYTAMNERSDKFHVVEWAFHDVSKDQERHRFLRADESFIICPDANGGIECGMHGHLGPNGIRGSANAFARMGRKSNIGHSHSARIADGVYQAGTSSKLDLGYNSGPSSWTHSDIITYENGKRAVLTTWKGAWHA